MLSNIFVNLTKVRVIREEGSSTEKMSPLDWHVGNPVVAFSYLMIDVEGLNPLQVVPSLGR